jgi:hypothetical protein
MFVLRLLLAYGGGGFKRYLLGCVLKRLCDCTYVVSGVGECNPFFILFDVFSLIILPMFQPILQDQNVVFLVSVI